MRIATSTNLVSFQQDGSKKEMRALLGLYAENGFSFLDLNFCEMMNPASPLRGDNWQSYVADLEKGKTLYGLTYTQSHAPYARRIGDHSLDSLMLRAMEIDARLTVPVIVIHPLASSNPVEDNVHFLLPFVKKAEELNLMIALENLEGEGEIKEAKTLLTLVDTLASDHVGVCLDTGHAWLSGLDPAEEIKQYGSRLIATHIADNHGEADEHLLPFQGTINWKQVMTAFKESGYQGDLTFECMKQNQFLKEKERPQAIKDALVVGKTLLTMGGFDHS